MATDVLAGKVALVTGGSKGIGAGLALALAQAGVAVVMVARDQAELDAVAERIRAQGGAAVGLAADLHKVEDAPALALASARPFGPIDILVNNAATAGPMGDFANVDLAAWMRAQVLNLFTPVALTRALLPGMISKGWGRILNISSSAARARVGEKQNAYGTSKAALESHTIKLALDIAGAGVTANALRPGATDTPMQQRARDGVITGSAGDMLRRMWSEGLIKPVAVPVAKSMELLAGDSTGQIVEMVRRKSAVGEIEDVVEHLPVLG